MADNREDLLAGFVAEQENNVKESQPGIKTKKINPPLPNAVAPVQAEQPRREQPSARASIQEARQERAQEARARMDAIGAGFNKIPVEQLPTQGLFYPEGAEVFIRAASGGEIRHWSTISDNDVNEFDDAVNYVLERCCSVKFPGEAATWKDLKEVDRLYIILAIRDFTFPEGTNDLKINISEGKSVPVHCGDVQVAEFSEKLMKHYNPQQRCFTFQTKNAAVRELNIYIPSVGVSQWLKNYYIKKTRAQEGVDADFLSIAPLLIKDYRGLNDSSYEQFIIDCYSFGTFEYSLIARVKDLIQASIDPHIKYIDEAGAEQTAPLNFRGGIRSIFLVDLDDIL